MTSIFCGRIAAAVVLFAAAQFGVARAGEPPDAPPPADAPPAASAELAQRSVVREAFRHELTQEFKFLAMNPQLMLIDIVNLDTEKFERRFAGSTLRGGGPKKKVRGAELAAPGKYRAYVACLADSQQFTVSRTFHVPIDAEPGHEYVLECVGYLGRNGDAHPVVHVKPLQSLAPGVTALSAECVDLSDVPLLYRLSAKNCKSELNPSP